MLLVLAFWIDFVRPRLGAASRWKVTAIAATTCAAIGALILIAPFPTVVATLNEGFFASAVLLCWVELPRPLPRAAWVVPVAAALIPTFLAWDQVIVNAAEVFAAVVIFPVALDLVDKRILQPQVPARRGLVVTWMFGLVAAGIVLHALLPADPSPDIMNVIHFLSRLNEVLIAVFLMHLYFTIFAVAPRRSSNLLVDASAAA
jgi:hypothetical protein